MKTAHQQQNSLINKKKWPLKLCLTWHRSRQGWQKVWKHGRTFGETKGPPHTGHLVLELVNAPPPRGEEERPIIKKISCSSADRVWNKISFGNSVVRNIIWIDYRSTINSVTIEKIENWKRIILIIIYTWYVIQRRSTILVKIFNLL